MVSAIMGGLALAGGVANTITSAVQARRQRDALAQSNKTMMDYYRGQLAQDPLSRADNQAAIKSQRAMLSDAVKSARARQIVGGATDDSVSLAKIGASKSLADTATNMAVQGQHYRDILQQNMAQQQAGYHNTMANLAAQQSQSNAQAASGAFSTAGSLLASGASGLFKRDKAER